VGQDGDDLLVFYLFVLDFEFWLVWILGGFVAQAYGYVPLEPFELLIVEHIDTAIVKRKCVNFISDRKGKILFYLFFKVLYLLLSSIHVLFVEYSSARSSRAKQIRWLFLGLKSKLLSQRLSITYKFHLNIYHLYKINQIIYSNNIIVLL